MYPYATHPFSGISRVNQHHHNNTFHNNLDLQTFCVLSFAMASAPATPSLAKSSPCAEAAYEYMKLQKEEDRAHARWETDMKQWERLRGRRNLPMPMKPSRTSLRGFAFGTPYCEAAIRRHVKSIKETNMPALSARPIGRPTYLEPREDEALVRYVEQLPNGPITTVRKMIVEAANAIRKLRNEPPVGRNFLGRWLERHPGLKAKYTEPVEADRKSSERDQEEEEEEPRRSSPRLPAGGSYSLDTLLETLSQARNTSI